MSTRALDQSSTISPIHLPADINRRYQRQKLCVCCQMALQGESEYIYTHYPSITGIHIYKHYDQFIVPSYLCIMLPKAHLKQASVRKKLP